MSCKEWLSCVAISVYNAFIVTYLGNAGCIQVFANEPLLAFATL